MKKCICWLIFFSFVAMSVTAMEKQALESLNKSAVSGDAQAQFQLAEYYNQMALKTNVFQPDLALMQKAVAWYEKAAKSGHEKAKIGLMDAYKTALFGDNAVWQKKWLVLALQLAEAGNRKAQFGLAKYYSLEMNFEGTNVADCIERSVYWYSQLLKGLEPGETVIPGLDDVSPKKVTTSIIETLIAELKTIDPVAKEENKQARFLYDKAIESDSIPQVMAAADKLAKGDGVAKNIPMAMQCYSYAAAKNNAEAQYKLSLLLYENEKNQYGYQDAYLWGTAALMGNEKKAEALLKKIEKEIPETVLPALKKAAISEAKKMVGNPE